MSTSPSLSVTPRRCGHRRSLRPYWSGDVHIAIVVEEPPSMWTSTLQVHGVDSVRKQLEIPNTRGNQSPACSIGLKPLEGRHAHHDTNPCRSDPYAFVSQGPRSGCPIAQVVPVIRHRRGHLSRRQPSHRGIPINHLESRPRGDADHVKAA